MLWLRPVDALATPSIEKCGTANALPAPVTDPAMPRGSRLRRGKQSPPRSFKLRRTVAYHSPILDAFVIRRADALRDPRQNHLYQTHTADEIGLF